MPSLLGVVSKPSGPAVARGPGPGLVTCDVGGTLGHTVSATPRGLEAEVAMRGHPTCTRTQGHLLTQGLGLPSLTRCSVHRQRLQRETSTVLIPRMLHTHMFHTQMLHTCMLHTCMLHTRMLHAWMLHTQMFHMDAPHGPLAGTALTLLPWLMLTCVLSLQ